MVETSVGDAVLKATLADTFDALSWEMELAAARCLFLDSVMGRMMALVPEPERAGFVESLHTIDLLTQQLTSLSAFSRRMSGEAPDVSAYVHTALGDITLGDLAERMSAALGGGSAERDDGATAGDLDLF